MEQEGRLQTPIMFVGALNGCYPFMTDLIRNMGECTRRIEVGHVIVGYGMDDRVLDFYTQGITNTDLDGYTVVFVDDICDTGKTLERVTEYLSIAVGSRGVVYAAVLTDRPERHPNVKPTVAALTVPASAGWLCGHGMDDYDGCDRYSKDIWEMPPQ
jgi:hypoxanthine-guanine phosphoribosyltransferase